jgi:CubicO group peptidase (beta-lactamase class C family)
MKTIVSTMLVVNSLVLAFSLSAHAEEGNVAGAEDPKPRIQPIFNTVDYTIKSSQWDQPANRYYSYSNFENLHPYPSIISRGTSKPFDIPVIQDGAKYLEDFRIKPWKDADEMNLPRYLYELRADAFIVMKDGKIVYEVYPRQLKRDQAHSLMSSSKSITTMIISNLIAQGKLSLETKVKDILSELGSAFNDVTLHQALNMNVAMNFSEDYTDPNSEGQRIFVAEGWGEGGEESGPDGVRGFLKGLTSEDTHHNPNNITYYNSAVTSVLGWIIQEKTGMNFNNAVSYHLFKHVGAGHNGIGLNDHTGYGHASGYISFTARDAALLYSAFANDGVTPNGTRIMPKGYIEKNIYGDKKATNYPYGTRSDWKYSHQLTYNDKGGLAHMGYGGQIWYANKDTGVTIVQMGAIDSDGGAVTYNSANALMDMAEIVNELLKDKKF